MGDEGPMIIYHGGCDDGFGAAWAAWTALGDGADYYPGVYQQDPPDVTRRHVYLLDFSYKRPVLEAMASQALSITVLDHHDTARADLEPLLEDGTIAGEFDMERSGAMMAWDWWHDGKEPPALLRHIQDRDLWRNELEGTREIIMALRSYEQAFEVWDALMLSETAGLLANGHAIRRYFDGTIVRMALENVHTLEFNRWPRTVGEPPPPVAVPCANVPHYAASEVAGKLAEDAPLGAAYYRTGDGDWLFSLRSCRDGVHVGKVAALYGGGGHPHAAGFRVDSLEDL